MRGTSFLLCRALLFRGFFGLFGLLRLGAAVGFGALGAFFLFSGALLLLFRGLALALGLDFGGLFSLFGLFGRLLCLSAAVGFHALGAFFLFSGALLLFYRLALALGLDFCGFFGLFSLLLLGAAAGFGALGAFFLFSGALLLFYSLFRPFGRFFGLGAKDGLGAFGAFFLLSSALLFDGLALALGLDFRGLFGWFRFRVDCGCGLSWFGRFGGFDAFGTFWAFLWFFCWRLGGGWGRRLRGGDFGRGCGGF